MTRWIFVLGFAASLCASGLVAAEDLDWWKTAVFYQVYPRSFKDSDGDGVGDLNGITSKLDHLKELGISGVWLSPIFQSPMADFGYDISDFYAIEPLFGTMADFDALLVKANELGIKLILDFVPNHSSDEHQWFTYSLNRTGQYTDYYVWRDPIGTNTTGSPIPPNEWMGAFSESVWTWADDRQQFYYHRYNYKQPDLNYRDTNLRKEMEDVIRFWLDKGVHGLRVDTIQTLVEDEAFPNVPQSENDKYCMNQPLTYDIVKEWRKIMDEEYTNKDNITRVMMLEAYGTQEELNRYYGDATNPGAHYPFNFMLINQLNKDSTAQDFVDTINQWVNSVPVNTPSNWVIGNHDTHRVASRYGNELASGLAMLSLLLPGIGVIYNGEEIGMVNNMGISYAETVDPAGCNIGPEGYVTASRDFERTPFQWDDSKDAGFSTADETWLPVHPNYKEVNLAKEKTDSVSYWHIYRRLMEARKFKTIKEGSLTSRAASENVLVVSRDLEDQVTFMVLLNLGDDIELVDLNKVFQTTLYEYFVVYTSSVASDNLQWSSVPTNRVMLRPKESIVLTSSNVDNSSTTLTGSVTITLTIVAAAIGRLFS